MTPAERAQRAASKAIAAAQASAPTWPIPPRERIAYRAAMAQAPAVRLAPGLEVEYREAFADALVWAGLARPKGERSQRSGPSGRSRRPKRDFHDTPEEFARQDRLAGQAKKSWAAWIRDVARAAK